MDKDFQTRKRQPSDFVYLLSESNDFDVTYNSPLHLIESLLLWNLKKEEIDRPESFGISIEKTVSIFAIAIYNTG
jgi:hypothetical protein